MPSHYHIHHHKKLLAMYRALLAEYLGQQQQRERLEVLGFLRTGIEVLRNHVLDVKGTLRGWRIDISDHPDDQRPNDDIAGDIQHQRKLLQIY